MIRPARLSDCTQLVPLYADLGYPMEATGIREILQNLLAQPDYAFLVMEEENQLLGFIVHTKLYFVERRGSYHRILALVVAKKHRHKGVATDLVNAVKESAQRDGSKALALNSGISEQRTGAHAFYEQYGFEKGTFGFAYSLD